VAFALGALICLSNAADAQPPASEAGFQDGFFVQSANGDHRLVFGAIAQVDGRFALDDPKPIINTFTVRKLRPTLSGRIARYFDFKLMPDFGNGTAVVQDAYFDIRFSPKFRIRAGKDKTPVGYELLIGDPFLLFPERALASSLVPNRDIGFAIQGDLSPKLFYAAGVFNGVPDGSSTTTEVDTNSSKDLAGRIVVHPFRSTAVPERPLNGFGVQVGVSNGSQVGPVSTFRTSVGQTYFSYATGVTAEGPRTRVTPAVFYYYKAFGAFGEFMQSTQELARAGATTEITNTAWEITGSIVLTGETGADRGVRPRNNFDPQNDRWGALQLVARYSEIEFDEAVFAADLAAAGASGGATQFTVGANWYPNPYLSTTRPSSGPRSRVV
jgi:phosphate-selective porin OprO/OprP